MDYGVCNIHRNKIDDNNDRKTGRENERILW